MQGEKNIWCYTIRLCWKEIGMVYPYIHVISSFGHTIEGMHQSKVGSVRYYYRRLEPSTVNGE